MQSTRAAVEAVWRIESGRLVAGLARLTGSVPVAEDVAQEALVAALETWPERGIPPNPAGWLMTTAKRKAIDMHRRGEIADRAVATLARDVAEGHDPYATEVDDRLDDHVGDDLLRLVFTACHPALSPEARIALTLRTVGGLTTPEIARAYLVPEPTVAQRVVRAKKTLARLDVPFELPPPEQLAARLASVLEVVYLVFNEGYVATSGEDWARPTLCSEAIRLGRVVVGLVPDEPEVHGLLALMEIQTSRLPARTGPDGEPVLLADQDRRRWDRTLVRRGLDGVDRAAQLLAAQGAEPGPYVLQAGIAACHARAATAADTDWPTIAALFDRLRTVWRSPVVELNRAVAVGFAEGPAAGLAVLEALAGTGALDGYPQLEAVRGDLLARLARPTEAAAAFTLAAALTRNTRERDLYLRRAAEG